MIYTHTVNTVALPPTQKRAPLTKNMERNNKVYRRAVVPLIIPSSLLWQGLLISVCPFFHSETERLVINSVGQNKVYIFQPSVQLSVVM